MACSLRSPVALFQVSSHSGTPVKGEVPIYDMSILVAGALQEAPDAS